MHEDENNQTREWKEEFIRLGGFTHLLNCMLGLPLKQIRSTLELKVIKSLVAVIFSFVHFVREQDQAKQ